MPKTTHSQTSRIAKRRLWTAIALLFCLPLLASSVPGQERRESVRGASEEARTVRTEKARALELEEKAMREAMEKREAEMERAFAEKERAMQKALEMREKESIEQREKMEREIQARQQHIDAEIHKRDAETERRFHEITAQKEKEQGRLEKEMNEMRRRLEETLDQKAAIGAELDELFRHNQELRAEIERIEKEAGKERPRGEMMGQAGDMQKMLVDIVGQAIQQGRRPQDPDMKERNQEFERSMEAFGQRMGRMGAQLGARIAQDALQSLQKDFPRTFEELKRLERSDQPGKEREVIEIRRFADRMNELKEGDPEGYELEKTIHNHEAEAGAIAERIRNCKNEDEREIMTNNLRQLLHKTFELRGETREREARSIETELRKIRDLLEKRNQNREMIVERRLNELLGNQDALNW